MFEARGVWNAAAHPSRADRINVGQLSAFRKHAAARPAGSLPSFVANDWLFRTNTAAAYGESWALSFFLSETRPQAWAQYLRRTGNVQRAATTTPQQRLDEFIQAFGPDLKMLESEFLRFMRDL